MSYEEPRGWAADDSDAEISEEERLCYYAIECSVLTRAGEAEWAGSYMA